MGVGVSCPKCRSNFAFSCDNCSSYEVLVYEDSKLVNYFQSRALYYFQCQKCKSEFDFAICPVCSKKILPQFPFVAGDKGGGETKKGCFVATVCVGENQQIISQLYRFRDEVLATNYFGKLLIRYYYLHGSKIAFYISRRKPLKLLIKYLIVYPAYYVSFAAMKIPDFLKNRQDTG